MLTLNALHKADPTKTTVLRKKYETAALRRFRMVRASIKDTVATNDAFGLASSVLTFAAAPKRAFAFTRSEDKINAFLAWLQEQIDTDVLEVVSPGGQAALTSGHWQDVYVRTAYEKAMARALAEAQKAGIVLPFEPRPTLLMNQPFHTDRLQLLYRRNFEELKGITQAMSQGIARELTAGLLDGDTHIELAKRLTDRVEKIGFVRARTLARTETISAYAESTLNTYEQLGIEEVGTEVEYLTARDAHVCPKCQPLEGKIYTIKEARGVIPRHPNCRCAFVAVVDKKEENAA